MKITRRDFLKTLPLGIAAPLALQTQEPWQPRENAAYFLTNGWFRKAIQQGQTILTGDFFYTVREGVVAWYEQEAGKFHNPSGKPLKLSGQLRLKNGPAVFTAHIELRNKFDGEMVTWYALASFTGTLANFSVCIPDFTADVYARIVCYHETEYANGIMPNILFEVL